MNDNTRRELASEIRERVPRAHGVYAFLDADGRLLYIGKSVRLRDRMSSYFQQDPLEADPQLGRLTAGIRSFAWWRTHTELLALLLEDVLIKQHLPPGNTRQKEMEENRYLELTADEFPTCVVIEHEPDFGDREVFGPFKDKHFAVRLRDTMHESLGIRTCREPDPRRRCLKYDIGRCSGSCRGAIDSDAYNELVTRARQFLRGDAEKVVDALTRARDLASSERRYEEAARLQDAIDMCARFESHQRFADVFLRSDVTVRAPQDEVEHTFSCGALTEPRIVVVECGRSDRYPASGPNRFDPAAASRRAVATLHRPPSADRRFLADRTRIVCNYKNRFSGL